MNMMSIHARDDDEHDEDHDHKDDDDHSNDDVTVLKNFVVALVYAFVISINSNGVKIDTLACMNIIRIH